MLRHVGRRVVGGKRLPKCPFGECRQRSGIGRLAAANAHFDHNVMPDYYQVNCRPAASCASVVCNTPATSWGR